MTEKYFKGGTQRVDANIEDGYDAVASDTVNLSHGVTKGIWVDVSGSVKVRLLSGNDLTLSNVLAGMWHPMSVTRIFSTGTTATGIKVGY